MFLAPQIRTAESPQERSPGVFSRIGSWLSWSWGGPLLSGDVPISQTQREEASEEDHRETSHSTGGAHERDSPALGETVHALKSPSLSRNAKLLISKRGGGDRTGETPHVGHKTQVCLEQTSEDSNLFVKVSKHSQSFNSYRRISTPDFFNQDKTMRRRRSGRRRRSSHGDLGGSQSKSPTNAQPDSPATTSLATSPQTACADSAFEEAENNVLECSGAEVSNSSSRKDIIGAEWLEAHLSKDAADSPSSADPAVRPEKSSVADSDMDEEPVVRVTESAESKRRSLKVSQSEKVFAKKVMVNSEAPNEDQHVKFKSTTDPKWQRSDERARCSEANESSHPKARIADKISLFERGASKAVSSSTNLRHLDISPAQNVANRLTEHAGIWSSSAPPKQTVKERAMNFNATQKSGVSGHALNEGHSKTTGCTEAPYSGSFENSTENTSRKPELKPKPIDQTDSQSHNATTMQELDKASCSVPTVSTPTDETPQVKSSNRTGSRSRKRRSKDMSQPLSPTSKNEPEMDQVKQEVNTSIALGIRPKPFIDAEDVLKTTDQCLKSTFGVEITSKNPKAGDIMQSVKTLSNTDSKLSQKAPHMDTKGLKEMKSLDEKEREDMNYFEAQIVTTASKASSSQPENSSNEVNIQRTGINSERQKNSNKKQPVQGEEGEGRENRDMIVNTLFGESGKLDPSVTKEEKPSSPEDLKAANSKDLFEPAKSSTASSRKDAMLNRESGTDMLVLPEKDATKAVNTLENDPTSDKTERPKVNHKSKEKDCMAEINNNSKKKYNVLEATEQLKTTETNNQRNEINTSKSDIEGQITTKTTKQDKSKDTSAVKPNGGRQIDSSTELCDQTKENDMSSRVLATPNPAVVKKQNDEMHTIISEGGAPNRGGPHSQGQSESREAQKTWTASSKRDLQQQQKKPSTETKDRGTNKCLKSKIISIEIKSVVNGDINSAETEVQLSGKKNLSSRHENTCPVIPHGNENLSLRSEEKKPTSLSSTANEVSTEQSGKDSEKITSKPASKNEADSSFPGSSDDKNITLDSSNEKTTSPQASSDKTTSSLPVSSNEKSVPSPASTIETISASGSNDDMKKPPPASTNQKNTCPSDSINEITTPPKATLPPASANDVIASLPASTNEKATPPSVSANRKTNDEKTLHPLASANEKITYSLDSSNKTAMATPASIKETIATSLPQSNENTTPSTSSANEKAIPLPASTIEKPSTLLISANEKTPPSPSLNIKSTSTLLGSSNNNTPSVLTNETNKTPPDSTKEEIKPPSASNNEPASTLPASNYKKTTPEKSSTKENALPPAITDSPASSDKTTKNERTSSLPASSSFQITSTNGEIITPLPLSKEKTVIPPEYTNGKTPPSPASIKEKTLPPHASTKEKTSHTLPSDSEKSSKSTDPATRKKQCTLKPFFLPQIPSRPGSSSLNRDSLSSWLDVDQPIGRKKQLISEPKSKLSASVSETNLNASGEFDPDDFIANVKRLAMPFNLPKRKQNQRRMQAPPSVLPAIREDRFEKPFDPEEFQLGLRKRREFTFYLSPSSIFKSQEPETKKEDTKPKMAKPERESILSRSLIFQRVRKGSENEEGEKDEGSNESTTEPLKSRSRLERCSIVSILSSPSKRRRLEFLSPPQCPSDGLLSPSDAPGSTLPVQSQLAPTAESPKQVMVEEVLANNDGRPTPSDSQVILKPSLGVGPAMTPDLKTTTRKQAVTMEIDTNALPSDTQTGPRVIQKPSLGVGPAMTPDLKTTTRKQAVTMEIDTNALPSDTQTGPQVIQKPSLGVGPAMTPDLKTTTREQAVTMEIDTNALPSDTQTGPQVIQKPTKEDGPLQAPELKTTSLDPGVTIFTDTNSSPIPSCNQAGSQVVIKHNKDNEPTMTTDLKTTSRDPTVTMLTDTKAPPLPSIIETGSGVVLQPDGPTLMPDLKTSTVEPILTMITDASAPPPLPSFEDIKLPSILETVLQKEPETTQSSNKIDPLVARESASIPGQVDLNTTVDVADKKTKGVTIPPAPQVPAPQILQAKPQRELPNISTVRGIHRRPAKIVIFEHHQFNGQSFEFYRDQPDATQMQLSSVISVKVVRGCWILYEKPGFEGRCIALEEESVIELPNEWAEEGEETSTPMVIGSMRLVVRDYTPPRIELFTEPTGMGRSSEYVDVTEEVGSFSLPLNTGSIKVHSGLWLVYSDPGFHGLLAVLEAGEYPFPEDWGFPSPTVGSLRPLRMGLPKVENPTGVKAVLYEKAGLEGRSVEVQGDVFSFAGTETNPDENGLNCVESLKILGGLWVGYEREGFDGEQFILEEGEYVDWRDWGGTGQKLLSLRPVLMDFSSPHLKMFSELDFSERGVSMDVLDPLENMADTHYGLQTRSIEVLAGVWVAFEEPGLSGRQYVLEKGLYGSPEDWGASDSRISTVIPVTVENIENSCHFQVQMFSEPGFGGTSVLLQDSLPTMPDGFIMRSCKVFAGSWVAFGRECFSGHQCVLDEGFYPDLRTMGFTQPDPSVLSIQPTGLEFTLPSVVLFERPGLKGRRTLLKSSSVNLPLTDSCTRVSSILVEGGMWVLYEASNFRGSQFLLKPGVVPDWPKLSSWRRIGSLRPLLQKQVLFRLRHDETGLLMSVTGSLEDFKLMRVQVSEETGGTNQIWTYQDGLLQCKLLLDCCVDVSSSGLMPGARAVLSAELGKPEQLWNFTSDGIVRSDAAPNLVMEVKGGQQFDKKQIILNEFNPKKGNQRWSLEIL